MAYINGGAKTGGAPMQVNQKYLRQCAEMFERTHKGLRWVNLTDTQRADYYSKNVWRFKK